MTATSAEELLARPEVREARFLRLTDRVRSLRTRGGGGPGERDRLLLVLGGVLVPLGLLLVVLGWVGASRTVLLFEQLPYIASGGLLGLALVVAGGFVYWSYWQTLLVREARADRAELTAGLQRLEALLERALVAAPPVAEAAGAPSAGSTLVATPRGSMLHRPDCAAVAARDDLRAVSADAPGMVPCRLCDPLADQP